MLLLELCLVLGTRVEGTLPVVDFELPLREPKSAALIHEHAGARLSESEGLAGNQAFDASHLKYMKAKNKTG